MRRILVLALLAFLPVLPTSAAGDCTATPSSLSDPLVSGVWQYFNDQRAALNEAPLAWSPSLAQEAAWMAQDIATTQTWQSDTDSLGRDPRTRATDCGYRSDAQVAESAVFVSTTNPFNTWNIWRANDVVRLYQILYSPLLKHPTYTVGAMGYYRDANGVTWWTLMAGTLADSGGAPTATVAPTATPRPTATPIPPTATPVPPTPTPDLFPVDRTCMVDRSFGPDEPFILSCDR